MNSFDTEHKSFIGFWVYLMTDLLMFAVLFACYVVFRSSNFGGPTEQELFKLPFVLKETLILLTSSFTAGLMILAMRAANKKMVFTWLAVTAVLGIAFLSLELSEFRALIAEGSTWQTSAFLSSFFALVGTHGFHITVGLLWIGILVGKILKDGLSDSTNRQLTLMSLFWHFLDVVWIFIFSIVYILGAAK